LLLSRSNIITPMLSFLTFENLIVAAIVAIRIGRNEVYEAPVSYRNGGCA